MSALTILLSPGEHADGVIAGLTDLSAAGLIDEFGWIRCVAGSSRIEKVTLVTEGRSTDVSLEQLVTGRQIPALRVATLVPATPDAVRADLGTEIAATNGLVSVSGAMSVTRVRFLLAGPEGISGDLDSLVIEGYHNVLVSPEDSRAPAFGRIATPTSPGPQEFARFAAPAVAGVTGLWSGVAHAPLDGVDPLPGRVVRLTRSFYRRLRTDDVEKRLRSVILAQNGELPLPSDQHSQVIYVQDPGLAASTMAQAFWTKHAAVLRSNLLPYEAVTTEEIGGWKAITMFFGFLWASLKNAPSAWYRSLVDNVSDRVAIGIQNAVFTDAPAAYEVVVRGRKANGEYASWDDVGAATEHLAAVAGIGQTKSAQADLSLVWQDYASASFTLADGGTRGVSGGLPPIQVGAARGVIGHSGSIVPGARERFSDIPGVVAAAVRTDGVDATDPLGIQDLRFQLHELQASPDHGLAAGSALKQLDGWAATTSRSFGSLVGERLATSYGEARRDMQNLFEKVRNAAAAPDPGEAKLTLARWTQVLVILWLVLTGVFIWLGVRGTVEWWVPVSVIVGTLVILLVCLCMAFIKSQRQLFALLHQRRRQKSEEAVDLQNLQTLISDVRRLWQAYGQFLSWSRAIGSFLSAPLGPDREQPTTPLDVAWGLPMSTSIGVAQPADERLPGFGPPASRALPPGLAHQLVGRPHPADLAAGTGTAAVRAGIAAVARPRTTVAVGPGAVVGRPLLRSPPVFGRRRGVAQRARAAVDVDAPAGAESGRHRLGDRRTGAAAGRVPRRSGPGAGRSRDLRPGHPDRRRHRQRHRRGERRPPSSHPEGSRHHLCGDAVQRCVHHRSPADRRWNRAGDMGRPDPLRAVLGCGTRGSDAAGAGSGVPGPRFR